MKISDLLNEAKSKAPVPPKPRNPVAKNANAAIGGGAAGAHKDKKKAVKQGNVKHKKPVTIDEAYGRRSSYYNPMDYERSQQRQMDYNKRDFKRQELQHELGHEDDPDFERKLRQQQIDRDRGPWYIKINGKIYKQKGEPKIFDWKKGANNYALAILKNRPELQGKILLTKKNEDDATEAVSKEKETKFHAKLDKLVHDTFGKRKDESATAGSTSAGNMAVGAVYPNKKGKTFRNKDGTAKNALDVKGANLMTGGSLVKR